MYQAQAGSQEEMMLEMMRAYLPSELAELLRLCDAHSSIFVPFQIAPPVSSFPPEIKDEKGLS